jgi:putative membrane protein
MLARPVTLALRVLAPAERRRLVGVLHGPGARFLALAPVVLTLDVGGMYAFYLTPLFALSHAHPWLQLLVHAHMFAAGCLLSWYVLARDPMPRRASTTHRMVMLGLAAGAHDVLAKLMYAHVLPHDAGSPAEVRAGAQLMFYGGDLVELLLAGAVMWQWYLRSSRQLRREARQSQTGERWRADGAGSGMMSA